MRRSGKTSLLRTGLGLVTLPHVIVDTRELLQFVKASYADLLQILEKAFKPLLAGPGLIEYLKG